MSAPRYPRTLVALLFGCCASASGQNFAIDGSLSAAHAPLAADSPADLAAPAFARVAAPGEDPVPAPRVASRLAEAPPLFAAQDALTLETRASAGRSLEAVVDFAALREPSPFRKVQVSGTFDATQPFTTHLQRSLAVISAAYRPQGVPAECGAVALSVEQRIKLDSSRLLEVVESEIRANPTCACEIVKAAILTSEAGPDLVADVVETAIMAAPDSMRMISQCAIAVVPESLPKVQAVLAKLDPNSGNLRPGAKSGAKSAKGGEVASEVAAQVGNPLNLPPPGPPLPPPPNFPPQVTPVD